MQLRTIILILFMSIACYGLLGQPKLGKYIDIRNAFFGKDTLYFERDMAFKINYFLVKTQGTGSKGSSLGTDNFFSLVYGSDTMNIKLVYKEWDPLKFEINKLYFIEGTFIIDLYECMKNKKLETYPVIIENFPCDCLEYRIEDEYRLYLHFCQC